LDVYIEPILPKPQLVIFGHSPVARYLERLGSAMNFSVVLIARGANRDDFPNAEAIHDGMEAPAAGVAAQAFVVVSTQGEGDEEALEAAVRMDVQYVAFVASKAKAQKVFEYVRAEGITSEQLSKVHSPAGLNIGATKPEEIAISILAEIVQIRRSKRADEQALAVEPESRDPVCGMTVNAARTKYFSHWQGRTFKFCCGSCKEKFDREPAMYLR
jgi:xanthine dehydrogenase accessory factor